MVFEHIEELKSEFTDKYVVVDDARPELRRFKDMTGVVKTVNMSGRALVEFDAHANIGWFDIDLDFLKVIDKPLEKPEKAAAPAKKAAAAKPAAKAKTKAPAGGAGMSVEDILAAAKGGAAKAPAKKEDPKPAAKAPAGGAGMSVADILAAARGDAAPAKTPEPAAAPEPEPEPTPEPVAEEPAAEAPAEVSAPVGDLPTEVDEIVAFCRERDS